MLRITQLNMNPSRFTKLLSIGRPGCDIYRGVASLVLKDFLQNKDAHSYKRLFSNRLDNFYCKRLALAYIHTTCHLHNDKESGKSEGDKEKKEQDDQDKGNWMLRQAQIFFSAGLISIFVLYLLTNNPVRNLPKIGWQDFYQKLLAKGLVREVIIVQPQGESDANGTAYAVLYPEGMDWVLANQQAKLSREELDSRGLIRSRYIILAVSDVMSLEGKIRDAEEELGISAVDALSVHYKAKEQSFSNMVIKAILVYILVNALIFQFSRGKKPAFPPMNDMFGSKAKVFRGDLVEGKDRITFKQVAGLHEPKVEIMEFVEYLRNPERFKKLGARVPKGVLLLGPPGCGKTLLAKALASEAGVPFLSMAGSNFIEVIGGLGAKRVRQLFADARSKVPCIVYIDEIDGIGKTRSSTRGSSEESQTLNQLLVELDGMVSREGVLLLASTNRAEILDKALTRPGRLDRHIMIDLPTLAERKEIFEMYLRNLTLAEDPKAYSERLAQLSPGKSGADIANICNEAALFAARLLKDKVDHDDFEQAVEKVTAGIARKSHLLTPSERRVIAFHEAGHAVLAWQLEHSDPLLKVSIVARTNAKLGFSQYQPGERFLLSEEQIFQRMCLALGGRVAEAIFFNKATSAGQDDLQTVTQFAYKMIRNLGMSREIGPLSFQIDENGDLMTKPYSNQLAQVMDQEASKLVARAYKFTEEIINENKEKVSKIAEALIERETLNYKDLVTLIGPPAFSENKPVLPAWNAVPAQGQTTNDEPKAS